jgi:tetratricopeptide (TPR) repeat protein/transglutaminase-like putative cysteine protease
MHSQPNRVKLLVATTAMASVLAASLVFSDAAVAQQGTAQDRYDRSAKAEVDQLLAEISSGSDVAVAMGKTKALERFATYVPNKVFANKLEAASDEVVSPLVKFRLLRAAQAARLESRDFTNGKDGMGGQLGAQGCLTHWKIVGPFENASMEGFHTRLGPEEGTAGPYSGKMTEVNWRDNPDFDRMCQFDLDATIEPSTAAVVYLATEIDAKRGGEAKLLVGADGAFKAWVNGEPVAYRGEDVGLGIDGEAWKVELNEGKNEVLVKLGSTGDGSLGLTARMVDPNLEPIADLTSTARWAPSTVDKIDKNGLFPTDDGLASLAARGTKKSGGDAVWAAWLWSQVEPHDAATPWRTTGEKALEYVKTKSGQNKSSQFPARDFALAAELFEEHWQKIDVLELAHKISPSDPWITMSLADEYGSSISTATQRKERVMLDELRTQKPQFLPAYIALADWYVNRGFGEKALAVLERYAGADKMSVSGFVGQLGYLTYQAGERSRAKELYQQMESLAALNTSYAWKRAGDLIAQGEYDTALELVRDQRELLPWSLRWGVREAELLRVLGDENAAITELDKLLTQRPGNVRLYRQKAELLVALNKNDQAMAVVEQAMARKPQDSSLREFKAFLEPSANRFYEPWLVDDVRALADKTAPGSFNYDTIVDQKLVRVSRNGLATDVTQRADRAITSDGIDSAKLHRVSYQSGDEQVEVLAVRVHKPDGTISEDFDQWYSGGARKGSTTYNDSAQVNLRANNVEVGDVVEFRYRVSQIANENFRGDYFGDVSYVNSTKPIAFARYAVHYPTSWNLHFRPPTIEHTVVKDKLPGEAQLEDNYKLTAFEMNQVDEVETDAGQPGYTDVYDYVMVSNKKTYTEIGTWWWNLIKEQLIVDDTIAKKVAELTQGLKTDEEKVEAIHNYVVKNTRYLHVGLGIHGWKPYRTTTCFRNRYGDCKDKAALLKVMLDEAGIPAKMVLVRTRRLGTVETFPASIHVFNHAITYVPSMDLYLDGTAEYNGTTELTPMDQGAQALVVDDGGAAKMVTLPVDDPKDNLLRQTMSVDLTGEEPVVDGELIARGQNAVYYRRSLEDAERRDEVFEKQLAGVYPGAELVSATYKNLSDLEKSVEISFKFKGGRLERSNQDRRFVFPYGAPKDLLSAYAKQASRTQDLTVRLPFENHTTLRYRLAPTDTFERIPKDTKLDSKFGSVSVLFDKKADHLEVDVRYSIATQRVKAEDYPEFRTFISEMTAALNETIGVGEE